MHYWIDPVSDPRWAQFINGRPSSVFHTPGWLSALSRTYSFKPLALTTSPPDRPLIDGIPFCLVRSIITGKRLVSLPFSDHCQPLCASDELLRALPSICEREKCKYIELRPLEPLPWDGISSFERYYCHFLDLRPSLDEIRRKFHPDCVRRKIRRAEREKLVVEAGKSDDMINQFYVLQVITRRKHGLPPQPKQWFRNLMTEMGDAAVIRIARFQGNPIAAILTLCHQKTEIYKYGCSLADENNRGGMQILFWKMIEEAKLQGMELVDLGRCDIEDESLALFKERWGAERREMIYVRHPAAQPKAMRKSTLMTRLPKPVLIAAGRVLYRHMG